MAAVQFATTGASPQSLTLTFTRNPAFPRSAVQASPALIAYRAGDGTPYVIEKGKLGDVRLAWTAECPMTAANFASLQTFVRYVRGTQDEWTFRDDDGTNHLAHFLEIPMEWAEVPHGFAGAVLFRVRT